MTDVVLSRPLGLSAVPAGGRIDHIKASEAERASTARLLNLPSIAELEADLIVKPFQKDGLSVEGQIKARIVQTCVVTSEDFESVVEAPVSIRFSPQGVDPNSDLSLETLMLEGTNEPPDLLVGNQIDLGAIVIEFLALSLDPYPRKPGVVFEDMAEEDTPSPFAKLSERRKQ